MKKRKELNALVANGKAGKRTKKGGVASAHELLDNESDSSDMENFSILQPRRRAGRKGGSSVRLCSTCLPLCLFVLVSACVAASGTLVWLHLGLREDLDLMRAHLQKVESGNKGTPETLHDIHSRLKVLDQNISALAIQIKALSSNATAITKEVDQLKQTGDSLKQSIAAAPQIKDLPQEVQSVAETVASIGSKISNYEAAVKDIKEAQTRFQATVQTLSQDVDVVKTSMQALHNASETAKTSADSQKEVTGSATQELVSSLQRELLKVAGAVDELNATLTPKVDELGSLVPKLDEINGSLVGTQKHLHHHHEQVTELLTYVRTNITGRLTVLESEMSNMSTTGAATTVEKAFIEKVANQSLNEALERVIRQALHVGNGSHVQNWTETLQQANHMVVIYATLLQQLGNTSSNNSLWLQPANATYIVFRLLNESISTSWEHYNMTLQRLDSSVTQLWNLYAKLQNNQISMQNKLNEALLLSQDWRGTPKAGVDKTVQPSGDGGTSAVASTSGPEHPTPPVVTTITPRPNKFTKSKLLLPDSDITSNSYSPQAPTAEGHNTSPPLRSTKGHDIEKRRKRSPYGLARQKLHVR